MGGSLTWKIASASVTGTSHSEKNSHCQDKCFSEVMYGNNLEEYLFCIVSDGAGSALNGGQGAEIACQTARSFFEREIKQSNESVFSKEFIENIIKVVNERIEDVAGLNFSSKRDYACTFLGAIVSIEKSIFFQVGDGCIVAASNGIRGIIFWPEAMLYANMTNFIIDTDVLDHLQICIQNFPVHELTLSTDGLQRLILNFDIMAPHTPFFDRIFSPLKSGTTINEDELSEQLSVFLDTEIINNRTDDDKTLILATRI